MKLMQKSNSVKRYQGFSLMELLIAMFIFSLVMVAVANIFGTSVFSYRSGKDIQKNLENAQFALNLMTKTFRTSSVISKSASEVRIFDYSQSQCIEFGFQGGKLRQRSFSIAITSEQSDPLSVCSAGGFGDWEVMTAGTATGKFIINSSSSGTLVGRVTVGMEICADEPTGSVTDCSESENSTFIQSTVSLRNDSGPGA